MYKTDSHFHRYVWEKEKVRLIIGALWLRLGKYYLNSLHQICVLKLQGRRCLLLEWPFLDRFNLSTEQNFGYPLFVGCGKRQYILQAEKWKVWLIQRHGLKNGL